MKHFLLQILILVWPFGDGTSYQWNFKLYFKQVCDNNCALVRLAWHYLLFINLIYLLGYDPIFIVLKQNCYLGFLRVCKLAQGVKTWLTFFITILLHFFSYFNLKTSCFKYWFGLTFWRWNFKLYFEQVCENNCSLVGSSGLSLSVFQWN